MEYVHTNNSPLKHKNKMKKFMTAAAALLLSLTACTQETIKLPVPDKSKVTMSVMDALAMRQSVRSFSDRALTDDQLSLLLWAANGINREDGRRTAPTAMNRQDIQVYVCRADGAFLYNAKEYALQRVSTEDLRPHVAGSRQPFVKEAPVCLVIVSDQRQFGPQGSPDFGRIDAGYVSQNVYLAATAMGLGTVARAMMDQEPLARGLGLAPEQLLLLNHPVGFVK